MSGIKLSDTDIRENKGFVFTEKPVYDLFKRILDILAGILCLTVGLPIYVVIAVVIAADDFGNPLFVQERIGKDGKPFSMFKFRTMYRDSEKRLDEVKGMNLYSEIHFKAENDPRVTRVGRFLRKLSLDELPQAVNLINGTMSVIGPRPFIPEEQAQLPMDRLVIRPGLSCYWQVTETSDMPIDEQLELDYRYIRERSFLTDLKIIVRTAEVVFKGKNS